VEGVADKDLCKISGSLAGYPAATGDHKLER
jgi:hypothetical protein